MHLTHYRSLLSGLLLLLGTALTGATFLEAREIEIKGRLLGQDGLPVEGAEVRLHPWRSLIEKGRGHPPGFLHPEAVDATSSGADGRFRVHVPGPGPWELVVRHRHSTPIVQAMVPLIEPRNLGDVELPPAREQNLRVVDEKGRGIAGFQLLVEGHPRSWRLPKWKLETRRVVTSEDGTAVFPSPGDESFLVAGIGEGRALVRQIPASTEPLRLVASQTLRPGRVSDLEGRALSGIVGLLLPGLAFGRSDEDGNLALPWIPLHTVMPQAPEGDRRLPLVFTDDEGVYQGRISPLETDQGVVVRIPESVIVEGRVVDKGTGESIPAALVLVDSGLATTDPGGAFSIRVPSGEAPYVSVSAPGYLAASLPPRPGPRGGEPLLIALEPAFTLAGRVVDAASGDGVPSARVRVRVDDEAVSHSASHRGYVFVEQQAIADRKGYFRLRGLSHSLPYRLRVAHRGFAVRELSLPPLGLDPPSESVEIALKPGRLVFGTLHDAENRPIAGADILLYPRTRLRSFSTEDVEEHGFRATSDEEGRFELADVSPGIFFLRIRSAGHAPFDALGTEIPREPGPVDLGTIHLEAGAVLEGRVVDGEDRPIPGAQVGFLTSYSAVPQSPNSSSTTDDRGVFRLSDLSPTAPVELSISAAGFASATLRDVAVNRPEPLEIVLRPSIVVRGRVVDAAGQPAEAQVELSHSTASSHTATALGTGPDGRFEFLDAAPGRATLSVTSPQGQAKRRQLELKPGQVHDLEIALKPGVRLRGTVLDPDGRAVPGAELRLEPHRTGEVVPRSAAFPASEEERSYRTSGNAGEFQFSGLAAGTYRLYANHPDFEPLGKTLNLAGAVHDFELRLEKRRPSLKVEGRVIDELGNGVEEASVILLDRRRSTRGRTTRDGRFEIRAPRPGVYTLWADAPNLAAGQSEPFQVGPGGIQNLVVELATGTTLSGRILGLDDKDHSGVQVTAYRQGHLISRHGAVDLDGQYRVPHLCPGDWQIRAELPATRRTTSAKVTVGAEDQVHQDLEFASASRLTGRVLLDGKPLSTGSIWAMCDEANTSSHDLRVDGHFEISGMVDGTCKLWVDARNRAIFGHRKVEIPGPAEVLVELRSGSLSGTVSAADDGRPLAGADIVVRPAAVEFPFGDRSSERARSDALGHFEFPTMTQGEWRLRVLLDGFVESESRFRLEGAAEQIEIRLRPTTAVVLVVRTEEGAAPSFVGVRVLDENYRQVSSGSYRPGPDGRVVLHRLEPGRRRLHIYDQEGGNANLEIDVPGEPV